MVDEYSLKGGLETEVSPESIKEKLRNLQEYMPDGDNLLYKFGEYIADKLSPNRIIPEGFYMAAELALNDLQEDGGENYPPFIYALIGMKIPEIAESVYSKEFGEDVKELYEEIREE